MKGNSHHKALVSLTALAGVLALTAIAAPTFAWHISYLNTCTGSTWSSDCTGNPTYLVGTTIKDTAKVTLSDNGGTGTITFKVYQAAVGATCAPTGSALFTSGPTSIPGSATTTITSGGFDTTGLKAGNYVWITTATYSDATPQTDCEPFKLTTGSTVPQFPLGSALVLALALPALLLIRARFIKTSPAMP